MPISSTQMSGLVGGQQAMFGNMATYAAQISPFAPPGMAPTYTNPMQGAEFPPSMGYVPGQTAYAEGGAAAPGIIGGAAAYGAPALALGGALAGGRMGGMLDPMTGAMRGFGRGVGWQGGAGWGANLGRVMSGGIGGIARGIGAGAIGMLPGLAIGGAIQYAGGQMMEGAQFQNQVGGFMQDQFRFANPMARGGFGMGQQGVKNIGSMLHEMGTESIGSTPGEMLNIMKGATSQGVFRGVRDAKEFQAKFKETVSALKEIAQTFNTTLAEAMPMFGEARRQGFWTPQDITRHAQQVRQVQATTGMSAAAAQQYTGAMAQTVHQIGGTLQQGSTMGARALSMAGAASMGGWVSGQQMQHAGFGTGAEGVANMGMYMGQGTARFAQSRVGRWVLAATMGKGGNLDPAQLARLTRGDMSIGDIQRMAERNVGGAGTTGRPGGAMDFVENEENLRGQMAAQGPGAMLGMVKTLTGSALSGSGSRDKLVTRKIIQRYFGGTGAQADLMAEMARNMPRILQRQEAETEQQADAQSRQQKAAMQDTWQGVTRQVGQWWRENVTGPLQKMGADISTSVSRTWQRAGEKIWGGGGQYGLSGSVVAGYARAQETGDRAGFNRQFGTYGMTAQGLGMGGGYATGGLQSVGMAGMDSMSAMGFSRLDPGRSRFSAIYTQQQMELGGAMSAATRGAITEQGARGLGYGGQGEMRSAMSGQAGTQLRSFLSGGAALGIRGQFGGRDLKLDDQMKYGRALVEQLRAGAGGEAIKRELENVDDKTAVMRVMAMQGDARGGFAGMAGIEGPGGEGLSGKALQDFAETSTVSIAESMRGGAADANSSIGSLLGSLATGSLQRAGLHGGIKGVAINQAGLEEIRKHPAAGEAMNLFLAAKAEKDPEKKARLLAQGRAAAAAVAGDKKSGLSEEARSALIRFANPNDPEASAMADNAARLGYLRSKENDEGFKQTIATRMSRMRESMGVGGISRLAEMSSKGKNEVARTVEALMGPEGQDPEARGKLIEQLARASEKDPAKAAEVRGLLEGVGGAAEMRAAIDTVSRHKGLADKKGISDTDRLKRYIGGEMGMKVSKQEMSGLTTGKWGEGTEAKFKERLKAGGWDEGQISEFMKQAAGGLTKEETMKRGIQTAKGAAARTLSPEATKRFEEMSRTVSDRDSPTVALMKRQVQVLESIDGKVGDEGLGSNETGGKGQGDKGKKK